jgi:uncharacterized protein YkwD
LGIAALWHCSESDLVDLNVTSGQTASPAENLVSAIMDGDEKSALKLLRAGADPNQANKFGDTALIWAVNKGYTTLCKELLKRGADPNQMGTYGRTALHWASQQQNLEVPQMLLQAGAKINAKDENLNTPLMAAAAADNLVVTRLLTNAGAELNETNVDGNTALMKALEKQASNVIEPLVLAGSSLKLANKSGYTALNLAAKYELGSALLTESILAKHPTMEKQLSQSYTVVPVNLKDRPDFNTKEMAERIHGLVNSERRKHGLRALIYDANLAAVAFSHSEDMGKRDFFEHINPDGEGPTDRAVRLDYKATSSSRQGARSGIGENIYMRKTYSGSTITVNKDKKMVTYQWLTMEEVARNCVEGWMNSPGHRRNILLGSYEREGLGIAITEDESIYITQNFF